MSVIDLHPEELLEKSELTEAERARLDAHLARCAVCRFEVEARGDFASEMAGAPDRDAALTPAEQIVLMVEGKLPEIAPKLAAPPESPLSSSPSRRRSTFLRRSVRVWGFAAAALLVGGIAGAGIHTFSPSPRPPSLHGGAQVLEPTVVATAVRRAAQRASVPQAIAAFTTAATGTESSPSPPAPSSAAPAAPAAPGPSSASSAPRADAAAALFEAASEAARHGDYARAVALSQELQAKYPASREAHVSYATMGQLLLDRGDAHAALDSIDAYATRGHDQLDESAMIDRARALERLGRTDDARAAWRALLTSFPATPYASYARGRLEGPPPRTP